MSNANPLERILLAIIIVIVALCVAWVCTVSYTVARGQSDLRGQCEIDGQVYNLVPAEPTPTQEMSTPATPPPATNTPAPSPTPTTTPAPPCYGTVTVNGTLNVRDAVWGQVIGTVSDGDILHFDAASTDSSEDVWLRIWGDGESPAWVHGGYITLSSDAYCPFIPQVSAPPLAGFHILQGDGTNAILPYANQITIAKCLTHSENTCYALRAANPEITLIYRSLVTNDGMRDCPNVVEWDNPAIWWAKLLPHLPRTGFDYYEIINECAPPSGGYAQLAEWSISVAQMVERDTDGHMLAFSFGPGNPEVEDWADLLPYLEWSIGTGHGIAIHGSVYYPGPLKDSPWVNNVYLAGRHRLVADYLRDNYSFDLARVFVAMTEAGLHDGYSGNWDTPYTCQEIASSYHETINQYAKDGIIDALTWWNIGQVSIWHSDDYALPCIFPD